jgi:hypothetical protein
MAIETKMTHLPAGQVENRCRVFDGQDRSHCLYQAIPGTERCEMHGGNSTLQVQTNKAIRAYKIAQWQSQIDHFHESDGLKSLREEIAIARITLQAILQKCDNNYDLMLMSAKIAVMLGQIKDLVVACNKLEDRLGLVLDKSAIINLASEIVDIVGTHVPEETLAFIADKIADAVEKSGQVPLRPLG